jgi:molybdopterin/thiamine biosynthesis adenylyltransferase
MGLNESERERYKRQLLVEGWHQEPLSNSRVLVIGLGGLGGICATYLAAAGVGHLRLCDSDKVELSNLNRQILYSVNNLDQPKAVQARKRLSALNPDITIESFAERLTEKNAADYARDCDLIIDGLDNQESRALLNRISLELRIPFIYGAIDDWQGQVGFFRPPMTPCLSCIMPDLSDSGRTVPVFGALPGIIGCLQATAALQYLMSGQAPLSSKLLVINANTMSFETLSFSKNPSCPVCGG